jgi:lipopolysaccharide/colanic/teichoic acid biosynthesis glycosyltransferase
MDLIIGFLGFIVFLILYIIIGPIIKLDSKGPILFKQDRIGKHGRIFKVYKFRTMIDNAEAQKEKMMNQNKMKGPIFKIDNDPRITKFGKFLRKTSIDEFPQFINVLKGDMSVVGTRPPTLEEVKRYKADEFQRISIVPGITGMWQVNGRSDVTDFKKILQIERDYIQNWSVTLDLFIILKTIKVVILCQGSE